MKRLLFSVVAVVLLSSGLGCFAAAAPKGPAKSSSAPSCARGATCTRNAAQAGTAAPKKTGGVRKAVHKTSPRGGAKKAKKTGKVVKAKAPVKAAVRKKK